MYKQASRIKTVYAPGRHDRTYSLYEGRYKYVKIFVKPSIILQKNDYAEEKLSG